MRAARLISAVLLLQSRGAMTASELARELQVSERTVYRDMEALSAAGVPVYADQGRGGGYRLVGGYRTRLTGLTREEAEALFLAGLPGPAEEMGRGDAVASAELKILAALPASLRDAPSRAGQRFHLDAPGWFGESGSPPLLRDLARAVWDDERVDLRYRRQNAEAARRVEPYGLVLKSGIWYLVARVGDAYRTYRVDRVTDVRPAGGFFERDESFDLAAYWAEQVRGFLRSMLPEEATVRVSPAGLRHLRHAVEPYAARRAAELAGEPDADGWMATTLPIESVEVAASELMRLGPEVEVLAPPELRRRMADAAARLVRLYASPDTGTAS
ncbi:MAG TPA: YafY family protein [Spirillospora sp.]